VPVPDASIALTVIGLGGSSWEVEQFQMDATHGNAYATWREMGSPRSPSKEQYALLEESSRLPYKAAPMRRDGVGNLLELTFTLPRQGVTLFRLRGAV
jgi:xylan 1,4-beta-xylosidase